MNLKRTASFLTAAFVMIFSFTSCKDGKSDKDNMVEMNIPDGIGMSESQLPYGATMTELRPENNPEVRITTEYDHRFLEKEEACLVSDYLYALQKKDTEQIKKLFFPALMDYVVKEAEMKSAEEYVEYSYSNLSGAFGGDFEFTYIDITDLTNGLDEPDAFGGVDARITAGTGSDTIGSVTSKKMVVLEGVTMYRLGDGTEKMVTKALSVPISICIYRIDGQYYIV